MPTDQFDIVFSQLTNEGIWLLPAYKIHCDNNFLACKDESIVEFDVDTSGKYYSISPIIMYEVGNQKLEEKSIYYDSSMKQGQQIKILYKPKNASGIIYFVDD